MGAQTDNPRESPSYGARVRMRVRVRPIRTSLPLADDKAFTKNGTQSVKRGEHVVIVFKKDVSKVFDKVEKDADGLRRAHDTFWTRAVAAVTETAKNAGVRLTAADMPLPDKPCESVNRWVETHWPYDRSGREPRAGNVFFSWLTQHCPEGERNPEAIFRTNTGGKRGPLPLEFAEVIEGPDLPPPLTEEEQTIKTLQESHGGGSIDVAAIAAAASKAAIQAMIEAGWTPPGAGQPAKENKRQ